MLLSGLPGELISQILEELPFPLCEIIHNAIDPSNPFYHYFYHRLNQHIKYGGITTSTHRSVTHSELLSILNSDHRPKSIVFDLTAMYKPSFDKVLSILEQKHLLQKCGPISIIGECPAVGKVSNLLRDLNNIQSVLFVGDLDDPGWTSKGGVLPTQTSEARFRMSNHPLSYSLPMSLKVLDLTRSELIIHHSTLPPQLEELVLYGGALRSDPLGNGNVAPFDWSKLPRSIRKLEIQGVDNADLVAFPINLSELSLGENDSESLRVLLGKLPENLLKLRIFNFNADDLGNHISFPDSIEELSLNNGMISDVAAIHWPANLKRLDLAMNCISTLKALALPPSVEYLNVSWNSIEEMAQCAFPPCLQTLVAHQNLVCDWTRTTLLESLEYLSLGTSELFDDLRFPGKLRHLSIHGHYYQDATLTHLPLSLESLDVSNVVFSETWEVPRHIKSLKISGEFNDISLPEGLRKLEFNNLRGHFPTYLPDSITDFEAWTHSAIYPNFVDKLSLHEVSEKPIEVPQSTRVLRVFPLKKATLKNLPSRLVHLEGRLLSHPPIPKSVRIYNNGGDPSEYTHPLSAKCRG